MKVLLDTVAVYRAATMPETMPESARAVLADPTHVVLVSLVSAWELAIKASLGKLALPCPIGEFFPQVTRDLIARQVGLELAALTKVSELPPHHGDPFDRLIIAQALVNQCAVMTSDPLFSAYGVEVVW
jgi:PIN domain nuclease of toxin-antitoxin system